MLGYSSLLVGVLVVGAPYWLVRMVTSGRYRAGLGGGWGGFRTGLRAAVAGRQVVWVHAVSVGEVLAATRLVGSWRLRCRIGCCGVDDDGDGTRLAGAEACGAGILFSAGFCVRCGVT